MRKKSLNAFTACYLTGDKLRQIAPESQPNSTLVGLSDIMLGGMRLAKNLRSKKVNAKTFADIR